MDRYQASMMDPPIEALLDRVEYSKFALVTLTGRRAREVTAYFNQLGGGVGSIVPPLVSSVSQKPVSIALEEIYQRRVGPANRSPHQLDPS
jgi:DNA-directed RNA polymerase subunit omega